MARLISGFLLGSMAACLVSCAVPFGPSYTIEKQNLDLRFMSQPQPHLRVQAEYRLLNGGNSVLAAMEFRLPSSKTHDLQELRVQVDGREVAAMKVRELYNDVLRFPSADIYSISFEPSWRPKQRRDLAITYEFSRGFSKHAIEVSTNDDAFFLSSGGWHPELEASRGIFGSRREAFKKWDLTVRVPRDFLVHASGRLRAQKEQAAETTHRFEQRSADPFPFIVTGRYHQEEVRFQAQDVLLWSRKPLSRDAAVRGANDIASLAAIYDSFFGPRAKSSPPIWVIERPWKDRIPLPRNLACDLDLKALLPGVEFVGAALFEQPHPITETHGLEGAWLGLGFARNFNEFPMPLASLPDYVSRTARFARAGDLLRRQHIVESLRKFDEAKQSEAQQFSTEEDRRRWLEEPEKENSLKSLLFFFALEDQFGRERLHRAIARVTHARIKQGYDLNDLRSALEAETGQRIGEFFRHWVDRPGIPADFRARYENTPAAAATVKENLE